MVPSISMNVHRSILCPPLTDGSSLTQSLHQIHRGFESAHLKQRCSSIVANAAEGKSEHRARDLFIFSIHPLL
jgi:type II secretory pathway component PulF